MTVMFEDWLRRQGCEVEITQEEEGNGYYCMKVTTPGEELTYDVTVTVG